MRRSTVVCYILLELTLTQSLKFSIGVQWSLIARRGANAFILSKIGPRNWSPVGNKRWLLLGGSKCTIFVIWSIQRGRSLLVPLIKVLLYK